MSLSALTRAAQITSQVSTGNLARLALGQGLNDLSAAYSQVSGYNPLGLPTTSLTSDEVTESGTSYLDSIRSRAQIDFEALPATDDPLPDTQSRQVAFDIASIETATSTINSVLSTTAIDDAVQTARELPGAIAADIGAHIPTLASVPTWLYIVAALAVAAFALRWWFRR
jgi:hypothetical protein